MVFNKWKFIFGIIWFHSFHITFRLSIDEALFDFGTYYKLDQQDEDISVTDTPVFISECNLECARDPQRKYVQIDKESGECKNIYSEAVLPEKDDMKKTLWKKVDMDGCFANTNNCDADATCSNTLENFKCSCNSGYSGDGTKGNCAAKWGKVTSKKQLGRFLIGLSDSNQVVNQGKLYIVLKSFRNKWVSAKDDALTISNDETQISRKEKFEISFTNDGHVSLKTWKGRYLSAHLDGSLQTNRESINRWEKFEMSVYGDKIVAFKSIYGKWISAKPDGRMRFDGSQFGPWTRFYGWQ